VFDPQRWGFFWGLEPATSPASLVGSLPWNLVGNLLQTLGPELSHNCWNLPGKPAPLRRFQALQYQLGETLQHPGREKSFVGKGV